MVLDEDLRQRIDDVAHRRHNAELLNLAVRTLLGTLAGFVCMRVVTGLFTGGLGALVSVLSGLATGLSYALSSRRQKHTRLSAARFIDKELSLEDRLSTAVECASLDAAAASRVEQWLLVDAANQTPFIKPHELVPYHPPRETRWLLPLLIAAVIVSLPIYPVGFSWQVGGTDLQQAATRADELAALADQIDRLSQEQPQLREVASLLRETAEKLRERRLPQSEALRLLHELEREMPLSTAGDAEYLDLDIDHIQSLAERLREISGTGRLQGLSSSLQQLGRGSDRGRTGTGTEYGQHADGLGSEPTASTGGHVSRATKDHEPGSTSATTSRTSSDPSGSPPHFGTSQHGSPAYGPNTYDDYEDNRLPPGGTSAGTGPGHDSSMPFERPRELRRELAPLPGEIGKSGQLLTGQAQGMVAPSEQSSPRPLERSPALTPKGVEEAVMQESIPLVYRHWIRRYFESLEPE